MGLAALFSEFFQKKNFGEVPDLSELPTGRTFKYF